MAIGHLFIFLILLFFSSSLLLICDCSEVKGWESQSFVTFKVSSLRPAATCSLSTGFNHSGLRVVHQHGPCSPFKLERVTNGQILRLDQARVDSLQSQFSKAFQPVQDQIQGSKLTAHLGSEFGTLNYVVTVGFGTPKKDLTLAFDTGSDLTWIQCQPCSCYPQKDLVFDPSQSKTYQNVSCSAAECTTLTSATGNPTSCTSATCSYSIGYGDGSTSIGLFGKETLTLTSSDVIPNFFFGCGLKNDGLFGSAAGLLGLGRHSVSLISQTTSKFNQIFSYCLPSTSSAQGYLNFGRNSIPPNTKFTPILTNSAAPSFYFLKVAGISVGGKNLPIPLSTFSSPGTIIDSGTVITRLPPAAYTALRSAFRSAMSNYTMSQGFQLFDTCYDFTGFDKVSVPKIALQFNGGADVDVDLTGIFFRASSTQLCLAFAPKRDANSLTIIGNRQQRTVNVAYDVAAKRIGFASGGCQ